MLLTKEIINCVRLSRELTFVKRDNGITYMICRMDLPSIGKLEREFIIENNSKLLVYTHEYVDQNKFLITAIESMKVDCDLSINTYPLKMNDEITVIQVYNHKKGNFTLNTIGDIVER